jgi:cytochrome P450
MSNAPFDTVDITASAFKADPHPTYRRWRSAAPVVRVPLRGPARGADHAFLVARYDDVSALLKDARLAKEPANAGLANPAAPGFVRPLMRNMLALDDPDHSRLKRLVQKAFSSRRVALMQAQAEAASERLIDGLIQRRTFDLVNDYALPLPVAVISEMLGVPEGDRLRFARWSGALIRAGSSRWSVVTSMPHIIAFLLYLKRFIAAKRANPAEDLVSDLVQMEQAGDRLNHDELMAMVAILLNAGHETTTSLIGNGILALLDQPEAAQELRTQPEVMETGIEELLRFAGPAATTTHRYAREDMQIAGAHIPRGSLVLGLISSANRDDAQFADAERLNLSRTPNRHLGFGEGAYYCVGAALARMEGKVAFRHLLERMPGMRLAVDRADLSFRPGLVLTGLARCPVILK